MLANDTLLFAAGVGLSGDATMVEAIIALVALTVMEIVLGIDNIIFIAILTGRLPEEQQARARQLGLGLALGSRILLLFMLTWLLGLIAPVFELPSFGITAIEEWLATHEEVRGVSWRDIILFGGGLFLIAKSTKEIHHNLEGDHEEAAPKKVSFTGVLIQIAILDIIFSLDSVITAVGMVSPDLLWVMVTAIVLAVVVMLIFAGPVSEFVKRHPTVKMLALSFLLLIGVVLVADGVGTHINKGYIYFAMAFSLFVEMLNLRMKSNRKPLHPIDEKADPDAAPSI